MAKEIYISVGITEYGNGNIDCSLCQQVDDGELDVKQIDQLRACKLMWELVLAGGHRNVRVNYLDRNIVCRSAYIFLPN